MSSLYKDMLGELTQALNKYPILSEEEQFLHCRNIYNWVTHKPHRDQAPPIIQDLGRLSLKAMVNSNLRLVIKVAKQYCNRGVSLNDLIQEGAIGLIHGLEKYDPTRGYKVSTYVFWWIRQGIAKATKRQGRTIAIPVNVQEQLSIIKKFSEQFYLDNGYKPSYMDIAAELKTTPDKIEKLLITYTTVMVCQSVDINYDDGGPIHQLEAPPDIDNPISLHPENEWNQEVDLLRKAIERLPYIDAFVIEESYFNGRTNKDIGFDLNVTGSRIAQIQRAALKKLRAILHQLQQEESHV